MYMEHVRKRFPVNAPLTPVIETIVKIVFAIFMAIIIEPDPRKLFVMLRRQPPAGPTG